MKPVNILIFLLAVLSILFIVSVFFPKDGIQINDELTLHFLTPDELFSKDTLDYADITSIINQSRAINDSVLLADMNFIPESNPIFDTIRANEDSLKVKIHRIEYPESDSTILYPFFNNLRRLRSSGELIRILHYGDSQIEGDRMTSYIRFKLQQNFGGSGIGLQPAVSLYGYQLSVTHTASDNWLRYTAFGNIDTTLEHDKYGALASFARFKPYPNDSLSPDTSIHKAWIALHKSKRTYSLSRVFEECTMYYGDNLEPVLYELYSDGELVDADFLPVNMGLQIKKWYFNESPDELKIAFQGTESPDFYGIALDGHKGIAVDNIPMRGCAGLVFTRMNQDLLKQMYDSLNVKLLLLQFGGNVVPYIAENYSYYERWFYGQLKRLKTLFPDIPIIVIGVSDMSIKEKDKFVSYPNLEKIRDALKSATHRAGGAYWDMYEAMGGNNSMPSWVYAQPPLATSDFVHFNRRGARVIAEMFYNAFIYEYENYIESRNKRNIASAN